MESDRIRSFRRLVDHETSASCQEVTEWHAHKEVEEAKKSEGVVLAMSTPCSLEIPYR